ncbi:Bulb-type lectin domain containing protein [Parasponia andersonii]|uniref:Bulb-type lectin domain containing protein n=1 Tax=Parasponia andersonii TaxID=3476 RepID=A0A2P5E4N9_PARAD|nr:Bulb-type lectin domain containing protein [Parasponia andersonii]
MDTKIDPRLIMLFFFLFPFMKTNISFGADTIYANHSLSGDQTIVSAGGIFVLGFFHPGNSSNYYIGMWYKQVAEQTIVWVANREKPVSDRFSSELEISDGNLVLFDESKIPVWSTNVSFTSSSVQAVRLDNGNLVLNNGSNSSKPLWQSFDIPVHTWLPGNSIGYNNIIKQKSFSLHGRIQRMLPQESFLSSWTRVMLRITCSGISLGTTGLLDVGLGRPSAWSQSTGI